MTSIKSWKRYTKKIVDWLKKLWWCYIWNHHDWTSAALQGIPPTPAQLSGDLMAGFCDYAKMYCARCKRESELSKEMRRRYERIANTRSENSPQ